MAGASVEVLVGMLLVLSADHALAHGLPLRVRGRARVSAEASRVGADIAFSGALTDDTEQPLSGESVDVRIVPVRTDAPSIDQGLRRARACHDDGTGHDEVRVTSGPNEPTVLAATTDEAGRFCLRAPIPAQGYRVVVGWRGSPLVDGLSSELTFDPARRTVRLAFDPVPRILWLDEGAASVEALALAEDAPAWTATPGLALSLENEDGATLATATTDPAGRARFSFSPTRAGPPGRGELRVRYAGDADLAPAVHAMTVERHAKVFVDAISYPEADNADDLAIVVRAAAAGSVVDEGLVQVLVDEDVVGSAPVTNGRARLRVSWPSDDKQARVRVRYVPQSPWFQPPTDVLLALPGRTTPRLYRIAILVGTGAVLAFLLGARIASGRARRRALHVDEDATTVEPRAGVVEVGGNGEPTTGLRGRVVDAHDGTPVAHARVWVERGTFQGVEILAEATANADGGFDFGPLGDLSSSERLVAEGRLHQRLTRPLVREGRVVIALVTRRRAGLATLVRWARWAGAPFDLRPEPTPGHVRNAASDRPHVARWAEAVEHAAFGPSEVDAEHEAKLATLADEARLEGGAPAVPHVDEASRSRGS